MFDPKQIQAMQQNALMQAQVRHKPFAPPFFLTRDPKTVSASVARSNRSSSRCSSSNKR
jgi:hypothetical protein